MRPSLILGPLVRNLPTSLGGEVGPNDLILKYLKKNIPIMPIGGLSFVDVRDTAIAFCNAVKVIHLFHFQIISVYSII